MNKKILIIYTGGTIGMDYLVGGLAPVAGLFKSQIDSLAPLHDFQTEVLEYSSLIDSSEVNLKAWQRVINDININYDAFDGFIVIHGTDTMAYTASILAFALRGLAKPVVLTGSQLPLVHKRSDGWSNLIDALFAASREDLHEVVIAFNHRLLRGARAQKISTYRFFGFDSVDYEPLAEFGIHINWYTKRWRANQEFSFIPIQPKDFKIVDLALRPGYTTDLIGEILETKELDGVVLQTYGSGNMPLQNDKLVTGIKAAINRGVIIVNITQVNEGRISNDYQNSATNQLGLIDGADMTTEAALAKLWILLSSGMKKSQIKMAMAKNLIGELTDEG